ncbi:hypothetical protein Scep_013158 [Stephania cephalantha]|uniref:Retrovirus-related Pol polyprotein from transposon TNT 1-94 n=1 Tax=Stephania cephalantha TaxID=152367 RepID=A0AAP0PAC1_9MAGN
MYKLWCVRIVNKIVFGGCGFSSLRGFPDLFSFYIYLFYYCHCSLSKSQQLVSEQGYSQVGVMTEERKLRVEKFDGSNFGFWKMQIEDYLYQKDLYLPLGGKSSKPIDMDDKAWEILDRKALGAIRLSLSPSVAFNISKEKTTQDVMKALTRMYEKPSASNKVFLMKRLFNMKKPESRPIQEHLSDFNTITSQLESVGIIFDNEVLALVILSGLPDSWDGLVMAVSNSSGSSILKFEDVVGVLLDEDTRRRNNSSDDVSNSALNTEERGRSSKRSNGRGNGRSQSRRGRSRGPQMTCWNCKKKGHLKRDCKAPKKRVDENDKDSNSVNVSNESSSDEALIMCCDSKDESCWILDSGASFHATSNREYFLNYEKGNFGKVYLGDDEPSDIIGKGDVLIGMENGTQLRLQRVRHVPKLARNLISVSQLTDDAGLETKFTKTSWKLIKGAMVVAHGQRDGTLYRVLNENSMNMASSEVSAKVWHQRLGHMSEKGMKVMVSKGKLDGLSCVDLSLCEGCVVGKQKVVSFSKKGRTPKTEKLELVHTDVWGPSQVSSLNGSRYYITFIDDSTRKLWIYFMKNKFQVFEIFKKWKCLVENQTCLKLKCLRSDNGGEYCNKEFDEYCAMYGIRREKTVPRTPQQNGIAERMNRTIIERARSMLLSAGLPKQFWAEAVNTAAYLINRGPSTAIDCRLPEEEWTKKEVKLSHLRTFGCVSYVHINAENRSKLDAKSKMCIFLGYGVDSFGYRLWDPESKKVIRSKDVIFNEDVLYKDRIKKKEEPKRSKYLELDDIPPYDPDQSVTEHIDEHEVQEEPVTPPIALRRERRTINAPDRYSPSIHYLLLTDGGEPNYYEEAMQVENKEEWKKAMDDEMKSLYTNQTWDLVKLPTGKKAIQNKWVYRLKQEQDGSQRYKARLVVKGFQQKAGIDFTEIFSPVVKMTTIRTVLSIVAAEDLHLEQLDVKTAFLHGDLEENIYMQQPQGYVEAGKEHLVCKLHKSLYGLKQAPRQWYLKFDKFMLTIGYMRCHADHFCYFKKFDNSYVILLLYVDDMLIAGSNIEKIENLKEQMAKEFSMKDLGAAKQILGLRIERDRKNKLLKLCQREYISKVLKRFNMDNAKPVSTPLAGHFKNLSKQHSPKTEEEQKNMENIPVCIGSG